MNSSIAEIVRQGTSSMSTDKLALVVAGLELIPEEKLNKIRSMSLRWEVVDDVAVPFLNIEFFG